jgi:methyl-accepting chemotaxis protein
VAALEKVSKLADQNAKSAEEAAYYCTELDDSFSQLKRRLNRILGRSGS